MHLSGTTQIIHSWWDAAGMLASKSSTRSLCKFLCQHTQVPMDTVQIAIRAFLFWILTDANPVQVLCHSWTPLWDVHRSPRCFEVLSPVHIAGTCSKKTSVTCVVGLMALWPWRCWVCMSLKIIQERGVEKEIMLNPFHPLIWYVKCQAFMLNIKLRTGAHLSAELLGLVIHALKVGNVDAGSFRAPFSCNWKLLF